MGLCIEHRGYLCREQRGVQRGVCVEQGREQGVYVSSRSVFVEQGYVFAKQDGASRGPISIILKVLKQ